MRWFEMAAKNGHVAAQNNLGFAYLNGKGVAADAATAATWFRKAAEQGDRNAQLQLGECLFWFDKLPLIRDEQLLQNILCVGLWLAFNQKFGGKDA